LLTEAKGIPIAIEVAGANINDFKLVEQTLEVIVVKKPRGIKPGMCMDKGYDYDEVREILDEFGYTTYIRSRGEEAKEMKKSARKKARRWVVERTHSWLNRFRGLLIRWTKKGENYLALLHLACGIITWRATGLMG